VKDRVASMRKSSREVFVSKIERVKGGLDFYFSTIQAARGIARELESSMCAEYKESSSIWGRRDGKDVYRMTYLVRLLGFGKGDIVEHESRLLYVAALGRGMLRGKDLVTGEERSVRLQGEDECALIIPAARVLDAVIVTESKDELQVLDPESMRTVDVRKPGGFSHKGDRVRLVKAKDGYYVLGDDW
jgi:nonsense-mediated mRNA decay protein 3